MLLPDLPLESRTLNAKAEQAKKEAKEAKANEKEAKKQKKKEIEMGEEFSNPVSGDAAETFENEADEDDGGAGEEDGGKKAQTTSGDVAQRVPAHHSVVMTC